MNWTIQISCQISKITNSKYCCSILARIDTESSFKDLILRIRADEAKHREINHTFANLEQWQDRNPFALKLKIQTSHNQITI